MLRPCDRCGSTDAEDYCCNDCGSCGICGCCPCYIVGCDQCFGDGIREGESVAQYHYRLDQEWEEETGEPKRSTEQQLKMDFYIIQMQDIVDKRNGKTETD